MMSLDGLQAGSHSIRFANDLNIWAMGFHQFGQRVPDMGFIVDDDGAEHFLQFVLLKINHLPFNSKISRFQIPGFDCNMIILSLWFSAGTL
jgi:hypothetical protein